MLWLCPLRQKQVTMTTILNKITSSTEVLFKQGKFNELSELFIANNLPFHELIIFYKRKDCIFYDEKYWQSNLPLLYFDKIIESDLKVSLLHAYFKNNNFCNDKINEQLFLINPKEFIRFIKFSRAFYQTNFWNSLVGLEKKFPALEQLVRELTIIRQKTDELHEETQKEDTFLLQFSLPELIVAFALGHHLFKYQDNVAGNKVFQTEIEMALVEEMGRVINLFFTHNKQNVSIQFKDNSELQTHFKSKIKSPKSDSVLSFLLERMQKMIDRKSLQGRIDLYCCGYLDFVNSHDQPYSLRTNQSHAEFVFNNKKSGPEEYYLGDMSLTTSIEVLKQNRISGEEEIKHFKYYGIPTQINLNGKLIDLRKVFKMVKHFSVYKGPPELSNPAPQYFKNVFGANEPISLFDYSTLIKDMSTFFKWEEKECADMIEFLSTNLDLVKNENENWLANPFIISQGKVLWVGTFLRDRRWENIILNKIKSEKRLERNINTISKNLELNVINLFKSAGFKAFGLKTFRTKSGKSGDVDVLAYRDGCLIIAEVKSGSRSDDFTHARFAEIIRLEGCAAEQLDKIEEYIKEDWEKIKQENNIETRKPSEKIVFYPMIITDYFEGDLGLYKDKYCKTSLVELDVIIHNNKEKLLKSYYLQQFHNNFLNENFNKEKIKIKYDLWNKKKALSAETLINIIESNTVWKEIENIWHLKPIEMNLDR